MAKKVVNMIEYSGISDTLPENPTIFTQITLSSDLCLPSNKPSIQRVVKVNASAVVESTKAIKTASGTSLEGETLTGYKLIASGYMKYTMIYIADDGSQTLYSQTFKEPFCEYIVLPGYFTKSTPVDAIPYLEDIIICDECQCPSEDVTRCISICSTIFLNVRFCCPEHKANCCCCNNCPKTLGISTVYPTTITYFKQFSANDVFEMPTECGCIDELISISSNLTVDSYNLVQTISGTSLEGQNLTGCKLAVTLKTKDIILYSNSNYSCCNTVQSITFTRKLCCIYVIVPCQINGVDMADLVAQGSISITPYIEDICAHITEDCKVYKCMTALLNVTTRCI